MDDEPNLLDTLAVILTHHGFEVDAVETVPEALQLIDERRFDLLLTDLNMPGDGFTVVRKMRREQPAAALMVLSGYIGAWNMAPADVRGMVDEFITKPADIPTLIDSLSRRCAVRQD